MTGTHFIEIMEGLNDLREHDVLCDVVLEVDGVLIPAHRAVLASFSPYFRSMFTTGLNECKKRDVQINGVDPESLQSLIDFAYTGKLSITRENVQKLLPAADLFELPNVRQMCSEYLAEELHPSNCIGITKFAESYQCEVLLERSMQYLYNHFQEIYKEDEFTLLSVDELKEILSSDELGVVNAEDTVLSAVQSWIRYDPSQRERLLDEILYECFRFTFANSSLLRELLPNATLEKCNDLIAKAINFKKTDDLNFRSEIEHTYNDRQPADGFCVIGGQNTRFHSLDR